MSNQQTEDKLKAHLKHWDEELPPSVAGKLRAARRGAMVMEPRSRRARWVPVMAAASAACVALIVFNINLQAPAVQSPQVAAISNLEKIKADDIALLTTGEELELLENVEFILWLAELDDAGTG